MTYTASKPPIATSEELRARIPGWGVDLDPRDRPAVPREQLDPSLRGRDEEFPERQEEKWPRERSIEHAFLTPVFGTSTPPKGLSGIMRKYAYRYSEARAAHWLILLAADRVDSVESSLQSMLTRHPDNPITETGVLSEISHHGVRSRIGQRRADVKHQMLDPIIVGAPWVIRAGVVYLGVKAIGSRVRRRAAQSPPQGAPSAQQPEPLASAPRREPPVGVIRRRRSGGSDVNEASEISESSQVSETAALI
jgi:hypothetical protein